MTKIDILMNMSKSGQWLVDLIVKIGNKKVPVRFKLDTGCNGVALSHKTLRNFGISTDESTLSKLTDEVVMLASGERSDFKKLGKIAIYRGTSKICDTKAVCHIKNQTNNLLGTEVFNQFAQVRFILDKGEEYMELTRR